MQFTQHSVMSPILINQFFTRNVFAFAWLDTEIIRVCSLNRSCVMSLQSFQFLSYYDGQARMLGTTLRGGRGGDTSHIPCFRFLLPAPQGVMSWKHVCLSVYVTQSHTSCCKHQPFVSRQRLVTSCHILSHFSWRDPDSADSADSAWHSWSMLEHLWQKNIEKSCIFPSSN